MNFGPYRTSSACSLRFLRLILTSAIIGCPKFNVLYGTLQISNSFVFILYFHGLPRIDGACRMDAIFNYFLFPNIVFVLSVLRYSDNCVMSLKIPCRSLCCTAYGQCKKLSSDNVVPMEITYFPENVASVIG